MDKAQAPRRPGWSCHNRKEEEHIFPLIEQRGVPRHGGPLEIMLMEHERAKELLETLVPQAEAWLAGDRDHRDGFAATAESYMSLLQDHFWKENLDFIESQLEAIFSQPRVLYHQDIGNLHVKQGRFIGFFDLEMCRVGCASMQLASASGMLHGDQGGWQLFREGWQAATGSQLSLDDRKAAAAANHALHWREITRYLSYDGTPGTGFHWASPADPARYREGIETVQRMLEVE